MVRWAVAATALSCTAVLLTACGGGSASSAAAPGQAVTVTATPAAAASVAAGSPVAPPSPAALPGPAPCPTTHLAVKAGVSQGTAGGVYQVIEFINRSDVTCTLSGYPGVSFGSPGPAGGRIGAVARRGPVTPTEVVMLAPGAVGHAQLRIVDAGHVPAARCREVTAHRLVVYPPSQTTPVVLSYTSPTCSKPVQILTVSVIEPGAGTFA
jgi:Protein of unknown function (DUF4232)